MDGSAQHEDDTSKPTTGAARFLAPRYPPAVSVVVGVILYLVVAAVVLLANWDHVLLVPQETSRRHRHHHSMGEISAKQDTDSVG